MTEQERQSFGGMGDLLKGISENPEMLSKAMNLASMLASSGALDSIMEKKPKESPTASPPRIAEEGVTPTGKKGGYRERIALLEAIRPFISDAKRDRLELLIRILGVMELYDGVKSGGRTT